MIRLYQREWNCWNWNMQNKLSVHIEKTWTSSGNKNETLIVIVFDPPASNILLKLEQARAKLKRSVMWVLMEWEHWCSHLIAILRKIKAPSFPTTTSYTISISPHPSYSQSSHFWLLTEAPHHQGSYYRSTIHTLFPRQLHINSRIFIAHSPVLAIQYIYRR